MVLKADQQRVKTLIKDTLTLLCKNGLHYRSEFCIEALIGITLDKDDVMLVSINETIQDGLEFKVQTSDAPSPAISDSSDSRHRTKEHSSPKPHTQSYEHSSRDSGLSSSAQTSPRSPAKSSSSVGSKHDRDSSGERKSPTGFGEIHKKRSRRRSSDSGSRPLSPDLKAVKLEDSLPDGSSFTVTTGGLGHSEQTGGTLHTPPLSQHDPDDGSDVVVIKDEVLSDPELEDIESGLGQAGDIHSYGQSGFPVSQAGQATWPGGGQYTDTSMQMSVQGTPEDGAMSQMNFAMMPGIITDQIPGLITDRMEGIITIKCPKDHTPRKLYKCCTCGYTSRFKHSVSRHRNARHGEAPIETHVCNICESVYRSKISLAHHMRKKHKEACQKSHRCLRCSETFVNTVDVQEHLRSEHDLSEEDFVYACVHCSFTSKDAVSFTSHLSHCSRR